MIRPDAEAQMYLDDILALTWNLSKDYALGNKDTYKVKQNWAKLNNSKYKLYKMIDRLKQNISITKINNHE